MDIDLVNGTILISTGLFIFLVGLAVFGLLIGGAMLATAVASYAQRRDNLKEIQKYNAMLEEIARINLLWYGNPNSVSTFPGIADEFPHTQSVNVSVGDMEFLEDRD